MVVGIANIIPGVSGGTMMVAMGLYDKLIHAITHLKSEFKNSMKLLIPIFIGAGAAIVILSRLFEFLLENYPIPTNFAFCGLIAGSLPFIFNKVKGHSVSTGKIAAFLIFFGIVILMALLGDTNGKAADVSFGIINMIKLFSVGIIIPVNLTENCSADLYNIPKKTDLGFSIGFHPITAACMEKKVFSNGQKNGKLTPSSDNGTMTPSIY